MTGRIPAPLLGLACFSGCLLLPAASAAQCRLCTAPTTQPDTSRPASGISLQIEAALDFDRLVLMGVGEGVAQLHPDGSRQSSGVVGVISSRAMVGSARVRGEPGRSIRIELPRRIELHSLAGGQVVIEDIASDLADQPRLDSAGLLSFRFGGKLRVTGDSEGEYRGDIPITVEYL